MVDLPNHPKSAEGRSSDGQPSDNSLHNKTERDANGNKEDNLLPGGRLQMISDHVKDHVKNKDQSQGDSDNSNHETDQQSSEPLNDDEDEDDDYNDDDGDDDHGSFSDEDLCKFWL